MRIYYESYAGIYGWAMHIFDLIVLDNADDSGERLDFNDGGRLVRPRSFTGVRTPAMRPDGCQNRARAATMAFAMRNR